MHTVFSTKERRPWLREAALRQELHGYHGGILKHLDCQPIIVGGVEDPVHLLAGLARACTAAERVKEVKRGSSLWAKQRDVRLREFGWQNGYGMFSIGVSRTEDVRSYIAEQEQHHRQLSFQDEFRLLLKRYELAYDERYVWD